MNASIVVYVAAAYRPSGSSRPAEPYNPGDILALTCQTCGHRRTTTAGSARAAGWTVWTGTTRRGDTTEAVLCRACTGRYPEEDHSDDDDPEDDDPEDDDPDEDYDLEDDDPEDGAGGDPRCDRRGDTRGFPVLPCPQCPA